MGGGSAASRCRRGEPSRSTWYQWPMARRRPSGPRQFARTDRIGELIREIVASELERIGDDRLEMVTITGVDVDGALEHAQVFYSAMSADEEGRSDEVVEALEERRWKVQSRINREVRARRTPQIRFRPDTVLSSALRIDQILRDIESDGSDGSEESEESEESVGSPSDAVEDLDDDT